MKKGLSSLEIAAIVNELQFLIRSKIAQIYSQEQELLLQLHLSGEGKQLLKIIPGKLLCLTAKKVPALKLSGFCMLLRKYLDNAGVVSIQQKDAERIVVLELEKKERFFLIIELFSKGNIILTDEEYKIIGVLEEQIWKDRKVAAKEQYKFPPAPVNWKMLSEKELVTILKNSDRNNLATSLAMNLGLGGVYAEEICRYAKLDKTVLPTEVKKVEPLIKAINHMKELIKKPQGFIYEEELTPFALSGKKELKKTATYNEAIDTLNPFVIVSPYRQKIETMERRIAEQEAALKSQQKKIDDCTRKGEQIYEHYQPLSKLLGIVTELRKTKTWSEIEKELKKEKKIKSVDLKNKRVTIEL